MSLSLNTYVDRMSLPRSKSIFRLLDDYPDAVNLTIGQPDFPTPSKVKQAGISAIENNLTTYSQNEGLFEAREAVASFFKDKYKATYDPESEIIMTTGSSEGLDSVFRTILNKDDEVLIPAPTYMAYETMIKLCGAKAVFVDTADSKFLPDPEQLESFINEKTKAILFNYPSNPTGATIPEDLMEELVTLIKKHDLFVVSDEIYSENVFTGKHHSFASYPEIKDQLFLVHGLSKSHSMTGWRIGFVLAPAHLMPHVARVHGHNCVCANLPSQYAAIEALNNHRETPEKMNREYIKRRDYIYKQLKALDLDVVLPRGTFYIFPSIKKFGLTSAEFSMRLLDEGGVGVLPGSQFTPYGEGFIRISYCYSMPEIEEGMRRFKKFIQSFSQSVIKES